MPWNRGDFGTDWSRWRRRAQRLGVLYLLLPGDATRLACDSRRPRFSLDKRLRLELIRRGVYFFPIPCKQGSVSAAYTSADIDFTLDVFRASLKAIQAR